MKRFLARLTAALLVFSITAGLLPPGWGGLAGPPVLPGASDALAAVGDPVAAGILEIAAGRDHVVALLDNGSLWAWGDNQYGQLGDGTNYTRQLPVLVYGFSGGARGSVTSIAAGADHSIAVLADGTVLTWGKNTNGQLGDGTTANRNKPVEVKNFKASSSVDEPVSAGFAHTMGINEDGDLYGWGYNNFGQLGNGGNVARTTPELVRFVPDEDVLDAKNKKTGEKIVQAQPSTDLVACGYNHTVAYAGGELYSFGANDKGQLGTDDFKSRNYPVNLNDVDDFDAPGSVNALRCGNAHTMVLSGTDLYGWGHNLFGQIDPASDAPYFVQPRQMCENVDVEDARAGYNHSVILGADGYVYTLGYNNRGQLGNDTAEPRGSFTDVHYYDPSMEAIEDPEETEDDPGFLGWPAEVSKLKAAMPPLEADKIFAGYYFSGAFGGQNTYRGEDTDDGMWLWGDNQYGQMGIGTQITLHTPNYVPFKVFTDNVSTITKIELKKLSYDNKGEIVKDDNGMYKWVSGTAMTIGAGAKLRGEKPQYSILKVELSPINKLYDIVKWESSNEDVAVVLPMDLANSDFATPTGLIASETGLCVFVIGNRSTGGSATITATAYNGKKAQCNVTVKPDPIGVAVTSKPKKAYVGDTYRMTAEVKPAAAFVQTLEWLLVDGLDVVTDGFDGEVDAAPGYDEVFDLQGNFIGRIQTHGNAQIDVDTGQFKALNTGTAYVQVRVKGYHEASAYIFEIPCVPKAAGIEVYDDTLTSLPAAGDPVPFGITETTLYMYTETDGNTPPGLISYYQSKQLFALVTNKTGLDPREEVTWSVSGNSLTITEDGVMTAVKPGSVYVTCTSKDSPGVSKKVLVKVVPIAELVDLISPVIKQRADIGADDKPDFDDDKYPFIQISTGQKLNLKAKVFPSKSSQALAWEIASGTSVSYVNGGSASSLPIAAVDERTGTVTGDTPGLCLVTASPVLTEEMKAFLASETSLTEDDVISRAQYTLLLEVIAPIKKITIEPKTLTLIAGDTYNDGWSIGWWQDPPASWPADHEQLLRVVVDPYYATKTDEFIWESSNRNAVAVDPVTGEMTAVYPGTAKITVRSTEDPAKKGTITVTVMSAPVSIAVTPKTARLEAGKSLKLKAKVYPTSADQKAVSWMIDWDDDYNTGEFTFDGIASINETTGALKVSSGSGMLVAVAYSPSDPTVIYDYALIDCYVSVKTFQVRSAETNKTSIELTQDGTATSLRAIIEPFDVTNQEIRVSLPKGIEINDASATGLSGNVVVEPDDYGEFEIRATTDARPTGVFPITLSFTCGNKTAKVKVTVYAPPDHIIANEAKKPYDDLSVVSQPIPVGKGKTYQFTYKVLDVGDKPNGVDQHVVWDYDSDIISVKVSGGKVTVRGMNPGTTELRFYSVADENVEYGPIEFECFAPVSSVKLKPQPPAQMVKNELILMEDDTDGADVDIILNPSGVQADDLEIYVTSKKELVNWPKDIDDPNASVASSDGWFTVKPDGDPGKDTITVTVVDKMGNKKTAKLNVYVMAEPVEVIIRGADKTGSGTGTSIGTPTGTPTGTATGLGPKVLYKGSSLTLSAQVFSKYGDTKNTGQKVVWESSNPAAAKISANGKVTVVGTDPEVEIIAYVYDSQGEEIASEPYYIDARVPVSSLTATGGFKAKMKVGETQDFIISVKPDGAYLDPDAEWLDPTWSPKKILDDVTVVPDAEDSASVSVTAGDVPGKATVTVKYKAGTKRVTKQITITVTN